MVTIDRKLSGIVPYRMVFFPTPETVRDTTEKLAAPWMARLVASQIKGGSRRVLRHQVIRTTCIDLRQSLDRIFRNIRATGRNSISRGERLGDRVRVERNNDQARRDFLRLYEELASAKRGQVVPLNDNVLNRFEGCSDLFAVYLDDTVVCAHMNLIDQAEPSRTRLMYSASRRFDNKEMSRYSGVLNCYLHWHEMRTYKAEGIQTYDFGGISDGMEPGAEGIDAFKLGFGGYVVDEHHYLCAGIPTLGRLAMRVFGTGQNR